jgi:hypothetical protein
MSGRRRADYRANAFQLIQDTKSEGMVPGTIQSDKIGNSGGGYEQAAVYFG